jgi:16S rRNA (cytosine1402-N4)-methyltransferase
MQKVKKRKTKTQEMIHEPVMVEEVLESLGFSKNAPLKIHSKYIDATLGNAGHTVEMVKRNAYVLGIEADQKMLKIAKRRLKTACPTTNGVGGRYTLKVGNFRNIDEIAQDVKFTRVRGILFDLGVTSLQLTSPVRGFSFSNPSAELDMRIDPKSQKITASDLLAVLSKKQLVKLFSRILPFAKASKLAESIDRKRTLRPVKRVGDLLEVVESLGWKKGKLHPATKVFLALRIAVNSELENLLEALPKAFKLIQEGGKLVIISFHSLEDRIVKDFFKQKEEEGSARALKKVIVAKSEEIHKNPRSRSAKLRVLTKEK